MIASVFQIISRVRSAYLRASALLFAIVFVCHDLFICSHGSMNRFHITHFGGLMPPSTSPNESPREEATNDPVARPAVHQAKDQKETTG